MSDTRSDPVTVPALPDEALSRSRGRPKSRYADRGEQVRQNMRLYRARRQAEQRALQRALEQLLSAVESGDLHQTFAAGAAVAGIWKESTQREQSRKRSKP
ncbi:hypothetical protein [Azovibrio restrictus]|uniref:hypothetical protein n=1 Tax=Azovibrio restrictus TaxID=146938 RepID=UPI0026F025C5|nr:hypothetical protein [Azovibrio restrictus]MDD3482971.1 hypothetical protein [Azovibrio restrictus]